MVHWCCESYRHLQKALPLPVPYRLGVPPVYTEWLALGITVAFMAAALAGCPQSTLGVSGRASFRQGQPHLLGGARRCLGSGRVVGMGPFLGPAWGLGILMSHACVYSIVKQDC